MKRAQHDIIGNFGCIIFFLFFLLFLSSDLNKNTDQINTAKTEIVAEIILHSSKATLTKAIELPSYHKNLILFVDRICFKLSTDNNKIIAYNRITDRRVKNSKNKQRLIKHDDYFRIIQNHIFPLNIDPVPILS
jgi:hypothetical protein